MSGFISYTTHEITKLIGLDIASTLSPADSPIVPNREKFLAWLKCITESSLYIHHLLGIIDKYNKDRLRRIKDKQEKNIYGHKCHRDVAGSISTMLLNPNKIWRKGKKSHYLT
jgi:predicted glutamine amidotransferase